MSSNMSAYTVGTTVTVTVSNNSGAPSDWVAISEVGTPDTQYLAWRYLNGGTTVEFPNLRPGTYEARQYDNWAGTSSYTVAQRSGSFTINPASTATVLTPQSNVATATPFSVAFTNLPGNDQDWIAIAPVGAPATQFSAWTFTRGLANGSVSFNGLPAGNYEARAFFDWRRTASYTVQASTAFSIGASAVAALTASNSLPDTPMTIGFSGFAASTSDWVAIAAQGAPANSFLSYRFTNGAASGTVSFAGLPAGNYEARGFFNWNGTQSYTVRATQSFSVAAAPTGATFIDACAQPNAMTGLMPNQDDNFVGNIAIPFTFRHYGVDYNTIAVSSNAAVGFGTSPTSMPNYYMERALPNPQSPYPSILYFNADLITRSGVCVAFVGTAPNRKVVVETNDSYWITDSSTHVTAELILNEDSSSDIIVRTQDQTIARRNLAMGRQNASASIGDSLFFVRDGEPMPFTAPYTVHLAPTN